jgi:putative holliday junction resolvase
MTTLPSPPPARPGRAEIVAWTLLGIDWGRRRIGLAIKPAGLDWALARGVLEPADEAAAIAALHELIRSETAQGVVVGLPLHPDPTQADEIRRFCRRARRATRGVRWFFVDERLTSQAADSISLDSPSRRPTDDLAAVAILETFLQSCE